MEVFNICNQSECTGCMACAAVCPVNAISDKLDKYGRKIASVDVRKCKNCGLCRKVCPNRIEPLFHEVKKCYAAWSRNKDDQINCASGGIATALSREMVAEGGVVAATVFDPKHMACQRIIENNQDIELLRGSRYVQSNTDGIYEKVSEYLKSGKKVLYIGTPCQVAGCSSLIKKREELVTVELICHGVAPDIYLGSHIKKMAGDAKVSDVTFRGKDNYKLCIYGNNRRIIYKKSSEEDYYFSSFLNGMISRENCYSCHYAREERISDLTIGDFWGIDRSTLKCGYDGRISVILVNTDKGAEYLAQCKNQLYLEERPYADAVRENAQLKAPMDRHPDRNKFLEKYPLAGFDRAVKKTGIGKMVDDNIRSHKLYMRLIHKVKRAIKSAQ